MSPTYNSLFYVTIAALLSPWLSTRVFRGFIPSVVAEIALGYLIGPHALHIAESTRYIAFLATFGFSYLMFLSGIELDFDLMLQTPSNGGRPPWLRGSVFFFIASAISLGIALGLHALGVVHDVVVVTLVLSTTSLGIVMPALKESGWLEFPFGQDLLLVTLILDVLTLLVFSAYVTIHSQGNGLSVLLVLVLLLFFVLVWRGLHLAQRYRIFGAVKNATSEMGLRGSFALILAFLAFSETLGTQIVVGAFLAGAIVSLLSDRHSILTGKLNAIGYGFLIPIFFVNVGMQFSFSAMTGSFLFILTLVLLLVGMYVNKLVPSLLFLRRYPLRQRVAGGALLSAQLSLTVAASQIASQAKLITQSMANGFILLAVVTCLVSPAWFTRLLKHVPLPGEGHHEPPQQITIEADMLPEGWVLDQIEVRSRRLNDVPMRSLELPQDMLIISILRSGERIIPRGHTRLEQFDVVQVMGDPETLVLVRQRFSGKDA